MNDHIDKDRLIDYQFDLLETDEKEAIDKHLEACKACREALQSVQVQFGQLDLIKDREEELADGLLRSIQEMAEEHQSPSKPKAVIPWPGIILTAAACLLVAGLIFFNQPPAQPNIVVSDARLNEPAKVKVDAKKVEELADDPAPRARVEESLAEPVVPAGEAAALTDAAPESMGAREFEKAVRAEVAAEKPIKKFREKAVNQNVEVERKSKVLMMGKQAEVEVKSVDMVPINVARMSPKAGKGARVAEADESAAPAPSLEGMVAMEGMVSETVALQSKTDGLLTLEQPYFEPGSNIELNVLPRRENVQLTIYNSEDLTLVRERRKLTMKKGWNWLQYMWKNTLIDPTSLELKPLNVDDKVTVTQLVFPPRMTGVGRWLVHSQVSGLVECEITYFTSGIHWRAFYEGTLSADESEMEFKPYVRIDNNSGETYDDAQTRLIVGLVSLDDWIEDLAKQKFAYGTPADSQLIVRNGPAKFSEGVTVEDEAAFGADFADDDDFGAGFEDPREIMKEALSEYQLFTIEGRDTIPDKWGKRMQSMNPVKVPVKNLYKYDEDLWGTSVVRFISFMNDEDSKLGDTPFPEGNFRVYGRSGANLTYVGASDMLYIPVGQEIELELGETDDVKVNPKLMKKASTNFIFDKKKDIEGWDEHLDWKVEIKNTRPVPVKVEVIRYIGGKKWDFKLMSKGVEFEKYDLSSVRLTLELNPFESKEIDYNVVIYRRPGDDDFFDDDDDF